MKPAGVDGAATEHADEEHQEALKGADPCDGGRGRAGEGIQ